MRKKNKKRACHRGKLLRPAHATGPNSWNWCY